MIELRLKNRGENCYSGSNWNYEKTSKYVLNVNDKIVEAGYFVHYLKHDESPSGMILKKEVIELPSSQGCPVKCAYCASNSINDIRILTSDEIYEIFNFIYKDNNITGRNYLLVTMTGIGDYSINFDQINHAIERINKNFKNCHFTISSTLWSDDAINNVMELSEEVDLRTINITFISLNRKNTQVILNNVNQPDTFTSIVKKFAKTSLSPIRINYIMIKGINDSFDDYMRFARVCEPIRSKVVIRVSKMNTTASSVKANLSTVDCATMTQFKEYLESHGYSCYLFFSHKEDNMNCGQLLTETMKNIH